jgi:hypothetical protein
MKKRRGSLILITWAIVIGLLMLSRTAIDARSLLRAEYKGPVGIGIGRELIGLVCVVPLYVTSVIAFLVSGTKAALAIDSCLTTAHFAVAVALLGKFRQARFAAAILISAQLFASLAFFVHSLVSGPFYFPSFKAEAGALGIIGISFYTWALSYVVRMTSVSGDVQSEASLAAPRSTNL